MSHADVLFVVVTQTFALCSHFGQDTLESLILVSVDKNLSINAYFAIHTHPDVAIAMTDVLQRRDYNTVPCTFILIGTSCDLYHAKKVSSSSIVRTTLWAHTTGADHSVTFINSFIDVRVHVQIFMAREDGGREHDLNLRNAHTNYSIRDTGLFRIHSFVSYMFVSLSFSCDLDYVIGLSDIGIVICQLLA